MLWCGIRHIWRRNVPIKQVTEENRENRTEVTEKRGRRSKQILNTFKEMRGYWKLKEEALNDNVENLLLKWVWTCH